MTIQADIVAALANIGAPVMPDAAPEDIALPIVIYRRTSFQPVNTLQGYAGIANSIFVFECYAKREKDALTLAATVAAAIEASTIQTKTRQASAGEDFEPITDAYMEPVTYSFWHS